MPCFAASRDSSSSKFLQLKPTGRARQSGRDSGVPSIVGASARGRTIGTTTRSFSIRGSLSLSASFMICSIFSFPPAAMITRFSMPRPRRRDDNSVVNIPPVTSSLASFLGARIRSLAISAPLDTRLSLDSCASTSRFHRNAMSTIPAISTAALISLSCNKSVLMPDRPANILPNETKRLVKAPPPNPKYTKKRTLRNGDSASSRNTTSRPYFPSLF
mmetsp:Transcript_16629/g.38193  ORF Transcript_16629/g.38193 Transcript_16629/m.38193 type:complete len:217 (-) Transcript_16629:254-904(-)